MHLELTEAEAAVVRELLQRALTDLREELHKTDTAEWKRALKEQEQAISGLIVKLRSAA
jgi:hypothetical protein